MRYRHLQFHAAGGLGEVFTASGDDLNRTVALKFIKPARASEPNSRGRFLFEAEVTGRLEHPGVVPVYGLGTDDHDCPCYAMRLIGGRTLQEAIDASHADGGPGRDRDGQARALRELLRRFVSVCNTVGYAHSRGVLHRDLKPKNVMLGPFEETLVVDWGLAKPFFPDAGVDPAVDALSRDAATIDATHTADVMGTPGYLSPEQARGEPASLASDVYSLGAMLYAILTGRPPLGGSSLIEALERTRRNEFPPARMIKPAVPRALDAICSKAMATRPDDRYAGAVELAADVNHWLADEPLSAYRAPIWERARRWTRRHRTLTTASAAAMVVALAGLSMVLVVQAHANAELSKAKTATEQALADTQESRNQTDAVNTFLVEAFRSPDPSEDGRAIRVVDVLDRATEKLEKEFTGSEGTRARLLAALSQTYAGLGLRDNALVLIEKARFLRQAAHGPDHPDTIGTCSELVINYAYTGRATEAIELGEATFRLSESRLGADHPTTLDTRNALGTAYRVAGRLSEAVALDEGTLRLREATLGADHPQTLESRNELANAYWTANRLTEAVKSYEDTVKLCESKLGRDHAHTMASRGNLAAAYGAMGRTSEAISLQEELLKLSEAKFGRDHPGTITSRNNLACSYYTAGRLPDAIPLLEEVLKLRILKQGLTHPETLLGRNNLGVAYDAAGRFSEAVALHEETHRLMEAKLGADHPDTLFYCTGLAEAYIDTGRYSSAIELLEATIRRAESKLGADNPTTLKLRGDLANAYLDAGRTYKAMELHEATVKLCESTLGPSHPDTLDSRNGLAWSYESLGRWADAERVRRETLARRRNIPMADKTLWAGDIAWVGHNLLSQAKLSDAENLLREGLTIYDSSRPDEWRRFNTMSLLGGALLGQARYADAEALVIQGYQGMKERLVTVPAPQRQFLDEAAGRVIRLYESWGKPEQAKLWRARLGLIALPDNAFMPSD